MHPDPKIEMCAKVCEARAAPPGQMTAECYEALRCAKDIRAIPQSEIDKAAEEAGNAEVGLAILAKSEFVPFSETDGWKAWKDKATDFSPNTISEHLRGMLADGKTQCPLCGNTRVHEHSPLEIVIYRNGIKYGRSISAQLSDPDKATGIEPCCQDFEHCQKPCTPRGRYLADKDRAGEAVAWMVARDSLHEPNEFFSCREDALKNACLGFNKTHVIPLYAAPVAQQDRVGAAVITNTKDDYNDMRRPITEMTESEKEDVIGNLRVAIVRRICAAPAALSKEYVMVPREIFDGALNYIQHVGANQVMRGEPHPQQWLVDGLLAAAQGERK